MSASVSISNKEAKTLCDLARRIDETWASENTDAIEAERDSLWKERDRLRGEVCKLRQQREGLLLDINAVRIERDVARSTLGRLNKILQEAHL